MSAAPEDDEARRRRIEASAFLAALEDADADPGALYAPSAARNIPPILEVLAAELPPAGRALEVASGTGQHAAAMAERFAGIAWTPSDADPLARRAVAARATASGPANLRDPLALDVTQDGWWNPAPAPLDAVVATNLLHISPWAATLGLLDGAAALLAPGGLLFLYGPFKRENAPLAPSNRAFDLDLKRRNPAWGLRGTGDVAIAAAERGLAVSRAVEMPADNLSLILRRAG